MADLKSATKNCLKPVEKTHAIENEKKLLASEIDLLCCKIADTTLMTSHE